MTRAPQRAAPLLATLGPVWSDVVVVVDLDDVSAAALAKRDAVLFDATGADRAALARHAPLLDRRHVAVVAFTTSSDPTSGLAALEARVDDLLTASASDHEIVARVQAAIRRRSGRGPQPATVILTGGPVVVDVGRRQVQVSGRDVMLTALELRLLSYFLMHPDEPTSREQLLQAVWGHSVGATATVTVHVRRLREKVELDPADPMLIRTVWGVGYRFSPSA